MRSIPTLALAMGLAVSQLGANATAAAGAAGLPQQEQTTPQADCRTAPAPAVPGGTQDQSTRPACRQANLGWRLVQRRPGFWIVEDVAPGSSGNAADQPPTVLHPAAVPAPASAFSCTSYPLAVVVDGQPRQATVAVCPQADGGWQITQYTPGLPPQVYPASAPPAAAQSPDDYGSPGYYPYWDWAGVPGFFDFAPAIVVAQRFHRFQAFGHGLPHGLGRGFAPGLASRRR
jgi:hypothetical protein